MNLNARDRREARADFGARVIGTVIMITMLAGGAWFMSGTPDVIGALNGEVPASSVPPPVRYVEDDFEPSDIEIEEAQQRAWEDVTGQRWSCFYDPTFNENWHDDVLCTDGPTSHRPVLLEDWGFVTEADMRSAGEDYEIFLNSGGTP